MRREDIELGDEVIEVERRPRAGVVVSVRLSADEADQLQSIAERRRTTLSRVAREALTGYLEHGTVRATSTGTWTGTVVGVGNIALTYADFGTAPETQGRPEFAVLPK